jgi:hypothetical protein
VERFAFIDEGEHAPDQLVAFEVGELTEFGPAAEMRGVESVATGATQRTFFRDLDR